MCGLQCGPDATPPIALGSAANRFRPWDSWFSCTSSICLYLCPELEQFPSPFTVPDFLFSATCAEVNSSLVCVLWVEISIQALVATRAILVSLYICFMFENYNANIYGTFWTNGDYEAFVQKALQLSLYYTVGLIADIWTCDITDVLHV